MATSSQSLSWRAVHLPKRGNSEEEYEDAHAANARGRRFAVADGASESSFAKLWATLLVQGFVRKARNPWTSCDWLKPLRQRWVQTVGKLPLPWYAETKRDQGAFATFMGLAFGPVDAAGQVRWRAVAVGDSCLFHVRRGRLLQVFPVERSEDFGNQPQLLDSRLNVPHRIEPPLSTAMGDGQGGDSFVLMTDALAQWALRQCEKRKQPWKQLRSVLTAKTPRSAFQNLVEKLRDQEQIRNDDATVIWVVLSGTQPPAEGAPE